MGPPRPWPDSKGNRRCRLKYSVARRGRVPGRQRKMARPGEEGTRNMSHHSHYDLDWIVSVDDHVIEPPNVWMDRLPSKYKDIGPRIIRESDGNEYWVYEDK